MQQLVNPPHGDRPAEGTTEPEIADAELFGRLVEGDEEALVSLYRRWRPALHRFALGMSGSAATADDVVQETFMIVMRDADRYDASRGAVGSYLRGIARHLVHRRVRRESRFIALGEGQLDWRGDDPAANPDPSALLIRQDEVQRVHAALLRVTPRLREVLVLCDLQGVSYAQAAETLRVPIGTVRSRLFRGREALAGRLKKDPAPLPAWKRALARLTP
jgi:RNA polymerase sigma-70 factor (ECF subfamily)